MSYHPTMAVIETHLTTVMADDWSQARRQCHQGDLEKRVSIPVFDWDDLQMVADWDGSLRTLLAGTAWFRRDELMDNDWPMDIPLP